MIYILIIWNIQSVEPMNQNLKHWNIYYPSQNTKLQNTKTERGWERGKVTAFTKHTWHNKSTPIQTMLLSELWMSTCLNGLNDVMHTMSPYWMIAIDFPGCCDAWWKRYNLLTPAEFIKSDVAQNCFPSSGQKLFIITINILQTRVS